VAAINTENAVVVGAKRADGSMERRRERWGMLPHSYKVADFVRGKAAWLQGLGRG